MRMKAEDGTGPVNADDLEDDDLDRLPLGAEEGPDGGTVLVPGGSPLPTLRVLPQGISRKRLEQAIRDLQLPVVIARDVDEADVVMTLRNEYKQKTPMLRDAEDRAVPIYVLKSNTIPQMQSSLTSIFSLEIDPREAAMRETEDAIESVLSSSEAVELSPQNAYIRRLQHQMAERANLVSRSRGREPYRRVRLYPETRRAQQRLAVRPAERRSTLDFIGHSAVVIELDGVRLLTDPVTRGRVGPLRRVEPVPARDRLRDIDAVLISHLHWDHLDVPSLRDLGRDTADLRAGRGRVRGCVAPGSVTSARSAVGDDGDGRWRGRPGGAGGPLRLSAAARSDGAAARATSSAAAGRSTSPATRTCSTGWASFGRRADRHGAHPGLGLGADARSRPPPRPVAGGPGAPAHPAARRGARSTGGRTGRTRSAGSSRSGWSSRRRRSSSTPRSSRRMSGRCRRRSAMWWGGCHDRRPDAALRAAPGRRRPGGPAAPGEPRRRGRPPLDLRGGLHRLSRGLIAYGIIGLIVCIVGLGALVWVNGRIDAGGRACRDDGRRARDDPRPDRGRAR